MKKTRHTFLFILYCFLLSSCSLITTSDIESVTSENVSIEDNSNNEEISYSESDVESISINESLSYEEDSDGFYMLENDYFKEDSVDDGKETSILRYSDFIDENYLYPQMRLYGNGASIPVYNCKTNYSQTWNGVAPNRMNNAVSIVELKGSVSFKIQTSFAINDICTIRPLQANITPNIDNARRVVSFTINSPGQYTIEFRSDRTLHLFVNSYKEFENYKQNNTIYFGKGIHNKNNSSYINSNNEINLSSNQTVFIDYGAIVQAKINCNNSTNVKVVGGGIIDGSVFDRNANTGTVLVPIDFNYCSSITFKGIAILDPAGWTYNLYFCNDVTLDNIKIISSRSNGDGVSVQSCKNVTCTNSFVRTWDDSLVVKNYPQWSNRNNEGTTDNILFENCIIWTDLAQSMEIGYETVGQVMGNITFNNITVLHNYHKAPISIHNANNANLKDVKFTNITIEDASMGKGDGTNILIDFSTAFSSTWSTNHKTTSLGSVDTVLVDNVKVIQSNKPMVSVCGSIDSRDSSTHDINNVTLNDVDISGEILTSSYSNYVSKLVNNLKITNSNKEVKGSTISYVNATSYGSKFIIETI